MEPQVGPIGGLPRTIATGGRSWPQLIASIIVMPLLARAKRRVGQQLNGDPLILADAAETRICVLLSFSTLAGLLLYAWTGAGWIDPVAGYVIAAFAVHEGREAWAGELVEDDD